MRTRLILMMIFAMPLLTGFNDKTALISLWERTCESCHDGQTVLNGKVVMSKEQIQAKYKTLDELVNAVSCEGPPCMNILKHDKTLVRKVGEELGIKENLPK